MSSNPYPRVNEEKPAGACAVDGMASPLYPRITLRLMGDWGNANFHLIVGLIAAHMRSRSAPGSQFWLKTGTGFRENIDALASGEVDLAVTTPYDVTLEWAREGRHFFAGTPYPQLRALGYYPQNDRLIFAVRADTGLTSFADIREQRFPLRVASTRRDPDNLLTYVIERVLELHGFSVDELLSWGGAWLGHDHPRKSLPQAIGGDANAVINEAVMVPQWYELVEKVPMRFIPFDPEVLATLQREYALHPAVFERGRLSNDVDVPCLDFSNWAVAVRADMDEELAYHITAVLVEERGEMESRYRHLPPERAPLTYPIDPYKMCVGNGAPLHPGAERYYREHRYLR